MPLVWLAVGGTLAICPYAAMTTTARASSGKVPIPKRTACKLTTRAKLARVLPPPVGFTRNSNDQFRPGTSPTGAARVSSACGCTMGGSAEPGITPSAFWSYTATSTKADMARLLSTIKNLMSRRGWRRVDLADVTYVNPAIGTVLTRYRNQSLEISMHVSAGRAAPAPRLIRLARLLARGAWPASSH